MITFLIVISLFFPKIFAKNVIDFADFKDSRLCVPDSGSQNDITVNMKKVVKGTEVCPCHGSLLLLLCYCQKLNTVRSNQLRTLIQKCNKLHNFD